MAKQMTIKFGGDTYTLEFTRDSVRQMESAGFNIDKAMETPVLSTETLFTGAFLANHGKAIKDRIPEKIIQKKLPKGILGKLIEMYNYPLTEMFTDDEDGEGNLEWETNF